jgi:flavin reductase (DIM6/NTAB) family NADH-FMN oxidoreductase RutF
MPCALVGVNVEGKPNYRTVAWFSMVNFKPSYRYLGKIHFTNPGIKENGSLSINIPSGDMAEVTVYCGIVSVKKL